MIDTPPPIVVRFRMVFGHNLFTAWVASIAFAVGCCLGRNTEDDRARTRERDLAECRADQPSTPTPVQPAQPEESSP